MGTDGEATGEAAATRTLLAVGSWRRDRKTELAVAAGEAGLDIAVVASARAALEWLKTGSAHAMLVAEASDGAERACLDARADVRLAQLPVLLLHQELGELAFAEAFCWGADDALRIGALRALVGRLRALPRAAATASDGAGRGMALLADPDRDRRIVQARTLRRAGFEISFAGSARDTRERAADPALSLVVASSQLGEPVRGLLEAARAAGGTAAWIVTCPPRDLGNERTALEGVERAAATDAFAPPENVLFLANELARGAGRDQRGSARLLYGTVVAFRGAGRDADDTGYTYNVSAGGLYVRTLLPPEDDVVWLEVTPPRSDRRVRIEGRVAWRRRFGPSEAATVPPGFGVQITDGTSRDLEAWRAGYAAFSAALGV